MITAGPAPGTAPGQAAGELEAILVTERDVYEHDIRPQCAGLAEGFGDARSGARHHHALPGEQKARHLDERTVVVD